MMVDRYVVNRDMLVCVYKSIFTKPHAIHHNTEPICIILALKMIHLVQRGYIIYFLLKIPNQKCAEAEQNELNVGVGVLLMF